jgi:preprotein translocase SecF subunit
MRLFQNTRYNFMAVKNIALTCSLIVICTGLLSLFLKGGPSYNIDFLGGTELHVKFHKPVEVQKMREVLISMNYPVAEIKQYGSTTEFLIRFHMAENEGNSTHQVISQMQNVFTDNTPELLASDVIGPKVGEELRLSAVWAVVFTLILLLIYIGIRFDFIFGVGAIIALVHDVLITLGFVSLFNIEVSIAVVAAFLTLVGYSLNDTIVVFDRIRENIKVHKHEALSIVTLVNMSINATLSRTIVTGFTTLIVIVVGLLFGGEVLRDFFLCLFIGILVGTYSSVFIAAPVVVGWYARRSHFKIKRSIDQKLDKIPPRRKLLSGVKVS